jgi:hypothetical protein
VELKLSNVWNEIPGTVTAVGLVCAAVAPMLSGPLPSSPAAWMVLVVAVGSAIVKALGK